MNMWNMYFLTLDYIIDGETGQRFLWVCWLICRQSTKSDNGQVSDPKETNVWYELAGYRLILPPSYNALDVCTTQFYVLCKYTYSK